MERLARHKGYTITALVEELIKSCFSELVKAMDMDPNEVIQ
jgi:hypothetical protein